jgi:hypothetical protein
MKIYYILFTLFSFSNCFVNNPEILNQKIQHINNKNNNKINNPSRVLIPVKAINNYCPEHIQQFLQPIKLEYGEKIVKSATEFLPTADAIAPFVLSANEYMINLLLSNEYIPTPIKKQLILNVIKISLFGDSVGSSMLHMYYDLVNCLL